ncbi:MAG: biotin/lipoyl-containing protein, partial [Gammaproteobacteria bacterium]
MSEIKEIRVPDIGDFEDVEIIEVHVESGAEVAAEDPLITLETDKAAMDVPSPMAGRVDKVRVSVGDKVSEGAVIVELLSSGEQAEIQPNTQPDTQQAAQPSASAENSTDEIPALTSQPAADEYTGKSDLKAQLVVLGAGPGGYTAAF